MTSDPQDPESIQGNGHDDSLSNEDEDLEQEYVSDEIHEDPDSTDNGYQENPEIETSD